MNRTNPRGSIRTVRRFLFLFNPSALGIVAVILIGDAAWVTPGQWGRDIWLLLLAAGGGLILLIGPTRMATTLAFGTVYALSLFVPDYR